MGFAAADGRDGWLAYGIANGRTAVVYCAQLAHLIARSHERQRTAIVLADNLGIHTPRGWKLVRSLLEEHVDKIRLVYTPADDPEASPVERHWPPFRREVTHNHHRDTLVDLYADARSHFAALDRDPRRVIRHLGSPGNAEPGDCRQHGKETHLRCGMI